MFNVTFLYLMFVEIFEDLDVLKIKEVWKKVV